MFRADHTVGQVCRFFSLPCTGEPDRPLHTLLKGAESGPPPRLGAFLVTPGTDPGLVTLNYRPE